MVEAGQRGELGRPDIEGFGAKQLLDCYARGVFPMADSRTDPRIFLLDPDERGVLPLDAFHVSKRLRRTVRADPFEIRVNTSFRAVVESCAQSAPGREDTWINPRIVSLYADLHERGSAHCVETWDGDQLVGGLYGVTLGAAFFGESMFARATDASKVALVHLAAFLIRGRFQLLDTQFVTQHLRQFGAHEISREAYHEHLQRAISLTADFPAAAAEAISGNDALARIDANAAS